MKTRRETPTLLGVGGRLPETLGLSGRGASSWVPQNTHRPGKFKASPHGGELFAFWHNFKLCTKGPFFKKITGDVGKETKIIFKKEKKNKLFHLEYSLQVRDTESGAHGLWSPHLLSDARG